jgi:hypothetical protein
LKLDLDHPDGIYAYRSDALDDVDVGTGLLSGESGKSTA